jgi:penicillin-binding protein 2
VRPKRRLWKAEKKRKLDEAALLRLRIAFFRAVLLLAFLILAAQLWRMQVVEGKYYQERAENNRIRVVPVAALRGVVYDRKGGLLVRNIPTFSVSVVPADLPREKEEMVAERLSSLLKVPPGDILKRVREARTPQHYFLPVPIKTNVNRELALVVEEMHLQLPGVVVEVRPVRQYLGGRSMSHILGHTGRISEREYAALREKGYGYNDELGKAGVELSYEDQLRGEPGWEQVEVDVYGRKISTMKEVPPKPGHNLVLSIDMDLQREMDRLVRESMGQSRYAVAVALDPRTGEVLAMVSEPGYDNNLFAGPVSQQDLDALLKDPRRPLLNYAISASRPPGSIFKLVTASAALQEGVANASTRIYSSGAITVASQYDPSVIYTFYDWAPLGWLDFNRAIAMSSDVYFYYLAGGYREFKGLGVERLAAYARAFGLGEPTGIDLPGETAGLIPDRAWKQKTKGEPWLLGDTYNMGIGQGDVLVSPLQMVTMVAAVANGGELLQPQVVREVRDVEGRVVVPFRKKVRSRVPVSQANLALVRQGMRDAVRWGTATKAQVPGVEVAGKTGTAEFGAIDPQTGQRPTHGWFLAFAPYEDPQIALVVLQEEGQGALTAAPLAGKILRYYFSRSSGQAGGD